MRILLLVHYYLPYRKSSAQLIHDLALEFRRGGHQVLIVAQDEHLRSACEVRGDSDWTELRVNCGSMDSGSKVVRAINEWRMSSRIFRHGKTVFESRPCDLIVYYSPTIFFGPLVRRLKKMWGARSYLVLRDIFPQWAVDSGHLRRGSLPWRLFRRKEIEHHQAADVIGVQTPVDLEYFRSNGWESRYCIEVLYIWKSISEPAASGHAFRKELGLENRIVFIYGGNIGVAQDMDNIVRLSEGLRETPEAHFLLVGDGSEVSRLRQAIAEKGLTNITILPSADQKEYMAMVSEADVGLVSLDRHLKTHNFPGKMLDYMCCSKPMLASINPGNDLKQAIEGCEAGLVSINGDDDRLWAHAFRLVREPETRSRLGKNARRLLAEKFSSSAAASQILRSTAEEE